MFSIGDTICGLCGTRTIDLNNLKTPILKDVSRKKIKGIVVRVTSSNKIHIVRYNNNLYTVELSSFVKPCLLLLIEREMLNI